MTELTREERIRRLQAQRGSSPRGTGRTKKRHGAASKAAALGASTSVMLGMVAGMGWNAAQKIAAEPVSQTPVAAVAPAVTPAASPNQGRVPGVLAAAPATPAPTTVASAPTTVTPTQVSVTVTRSGGSR